MTTPPPRSTDRKIANRRILVVDDNPAIHADFRKILCPHIDEHSVIDNLEGVLFDEVTQHIDFVAFELQSAHQGQDALEMVKAARDRDRPFALAFVDVRMPPGWDGIETIARLWKVDPSLQVVICTAYSDYSWDDMRGRLGQPENLVVLKKPFDNVEVQQLAHALTRKWELNIEAETATAQLANVVRYMRAMIDQEPKRDSKPALPKPDTEPPHPAHSTTHPNPNPQPGSQPPRTDASSPNPASSRPPHSPVIAQAPTAPGSTKDRPQLGETLMGLKQNLENTIRQLRDTEVQLVQAEKMSSLGRLAASIFHEIYNPLNFTLMASDHAARIAKNAPEDFRGDLQDTVADIREGVVAILDIIKDLREFTHPEYGHLDLVDVNLSLTTALRLLGAEIRDQIHIENHIPEGFTVRAVRNRLTQVFLNLIQNSLDALALKSFEPGTRPEIRFEASTHEGTRTLRVRDNGPGVPAQNLGKLFEPFFTTKSVGRGTGLGLSICYRLLRDVGAELTVHSEEHKFCEFRLNFPERPEMPPESPVHDDSLASAQI
jgi:two-component system NtrC family sensor kinase